MEPAHRLLKEFNPEYTGLRILHDQTSPSVNVIAIHGLAADPVGTWFQKKEANWNWLENQLVHSLPRARVWTFGYDSSWCGDFSVETTLGEVAGRLLTAIKAKNLHHVPLIFVAHSFGGIVVLKSLMMAENPDNEWSTNGKALSLFRFTDTILFFGVPFRGIHEWFQSDLPMLAKKMGLMVRDDVFRDFRKDNPTLEELTQDFIDKCHRYKKPNVGYFWERHLSPVGRIVGDTTIQPVMLVEKNSAVIQHVSAVEKPWFVKHGLDRNHFDMHNFGPRDSLFDNTIKLVLDKIASSFRVFNSDEWLHSYTPDENACLRSLSFPEMYEREHDVVNAINDTCNWLFEDPVYLQWFIQQHGILWIKGHPGVGKSTLMKHTVRNVRKDKTAVFASYFFHGRGASIQHNNSGLFRSLLHQIMMQIPDICNKITFIFDRKCQTLGEYQKHWEWNENELQDLFVTHSLEAAKKHQIRICIDALDECGEDAAVDLVEIFRGLADSLSICFSCRYYPLIALEDGLEISVEKNNAQDIEKYLRHQPIASHLREHITKRASGNFQWVKIVTDKVRQLLRKGNSSKTIQNMISYLPVELSKLYEGFLTTIEESDKAQSFKLLQWICFAIKPLSLSDLRFAMAMDEDISYFSILQCQESDLYVDTDEAMDKRICDLSQGLAESTEVCGKRFVQLIHQSVDDFLLDKGLQMLSQGQLLHGNLFGCSHFRLSRSCIQYLSISEIQDFGFTVDLNGVEGIDRFRNHVSDLFPFLEYASMFWIQHASMAEQQNIPQADLISYFHSNSQSPSDLFVSWARTYTLFHEFNMMHSKDMMLLHVAAGSGLLSVLKEALSQGIELSPIDRKGRTPLLWAARKGHELLVKWLLERDEVMVNWRDRRGNTAFAWAAREGQEKIIELLLERDDVMTDSTDEDGNSPFAWAAQRSHGVVMKLLLNRTDVRVDSRDNWGQTPLSNAAKCGHEAVMKFLLERDDVAADSQDVEGHTPLYWAVRGGHEAAVQLLLERNDVMADRDSNDGTPLSWAAMIGHERIVKMLLERDDVNANARDSYDLTPLSLAAGRGHEAVVRLLLECDDVDANARNSYDRTPLSLAAGRGHEAVVRSLLECDDVDANARDSYDRTPLSLAAEYGHETVVKLLLKCEDVETDIRTCYGQTPLSLAAEYGHETVVKLLLELPDVCADSFCNSKTSFFRAVKKGHESMAEVLLEGDDVEADLKNIDNQSPLSLAAENGHEAVVQLLLERDEVANDQADILKSLIVAQIHKRKAIVEILKQHLS